MKTRRHLTAWACAWTLASIAILSGCDTGVPNPAGDPIPGPEGAMGEKGDTGDPGTPGEQGDPGASPFELKGDNAFYDVGNVGIGTDAPNCKLEVVGGFCTDAFKLGADPAESLVLKSDADGNGSWQTDGLALPFVAGVTDVGTLFDLTNTGDGGAGSFAIDNVANAATALKGMTNGTGDGVSGVGMAASAAGVRGRNEALDGFGMIAEGGGMSGGLFASSELVNAGRFETLDAANASAAVFVKQIGDGAGLTVQTNKPLMTEPTIAAVQDGDGPALTLAKTRPVGSARAVEISNAGFGGGLRIQLTNASNGGRGVEVAQSGVGPGVFATSTGGNGLWGITSSISAAGVIGDNTFGEAVVGRNQGETGVGSVVGRNDGVGGYGVRGFVTKNTAIGVIGQAGISGGLNTAGRFENINAANTSDVVQISTNNATSIGLRVSTPNSTGAAARFQGNVTVTGNLSKGGGSFKIDHPLDPENKYLYHSFVESPDMMNVYNGNQTLDAAGEAWITLPDWFQALNGDYRYQLTAIGAPGPNLFIAEEITGNKFKIAGGTPGMRVSWQVTGVRHDAYAMKHRIPVEEDKADENKGTYLHPDAYNVAESRGEKFEPASDVAQNLVRGVGRPTLASEQDLPPAHTTDSQN